MGDVASWCSGGESNDEEEMSARADGEVAGGAEQHGRVKHQGGASGGEAVSRRGARGLGLGKFGKWVRERAAAPRVSYS